jgi:arabinose-5-phosphate isomerase
MENFSEKDILNIARDCIEIEASGLRKAMENLDSGFFKAVQIILGASGRVVVSGIGKSGLIGKKIAATLASTGTPSIFLHPVEAMHGDIGVISSDDSMIAVSNSGETQELISLLPIFRERRIPIIAITGRKKSSLARASQAVINASVEKEACSLGLAPTASTTTALALGDALSVALLRIRKFNQEDFMKNHPGGTLGERLKVKISEVMVTGFDLPLTKSGTPMPQALSEMDQKRLGAVLVLNGEECLTGIITDGDLRRSFVKNKDILKLLVDDVMTPSPKAVSPDALAADAIALMETHLITVLPVVDEQGKLQGMVHLHDLLGKGQFKFSI